MTDIEKWHERLNTTFGHEGVIGEELLLLDEAEARYGAWVADSFRGFMALSEAFLVLHFSLPELVNEYVAAPLRESGRSASAGYNLGLVRHATDFRVLRASRRLFFVGAPYEGAALLRPVFDAALIRSALMQGITTVAQSEGIEGHKPGESIDAEAVRRARIKEEKRIDDIMVGGKSGLPAEVQRELARWEGLLHAEIHGARVSQAAALGWLKGETPLYMMPRPDPTGAAMLMNRWVEVAWLVHRLMPTLQLPGIAFPSEWANQWTVLDESFAPMVQSLSSEMGKTIGDAMVTFVNSKFSFSAQSACTC